MRILGKLVFMLTLSLSLFACGPVYRTITQYDSPPSDAGKQCVMQCETHRKQCKGDCDARYDACTYEAEERGRAEFLDAKEDYLNQKEHCLTRNYKKPHKECEDLKEPMLRDFTHDASCRSNCGCDDDFDRCFQVCGGQIRYEKHCVSGCDKQ